MHQSHAPGRCPLSTCGHMLARRLTMKRSPCASGGINLAETLRGLRSNDAENRSDRLRTKHSVILTLKRFTDSAGLFPLGCHDEFALVQRVLAVIIGIMEGHFASPMAAGAQRMSLGPDLLEACVGDAGISAQDADLLHNIAKNRTVGAEAETPAPFRLG